MAIGIQTCRDRVKDYCKENKIKQSDFAGLINLCKSTFSRFMGAGAETTGKGSLAYPAIVRFFGKIDRAKKAARRQQERNAVYTSSHVHNVLTEGSQNKDRKAEDTQDQITAKRINIVEDHDVRINSCVAVIDLSLSPAHAADVV